MSAAAGPERRELICSLLEELAAAARSEGYAHLIYRPAQDDWDAVHAAEQAGLLLIDVGVDFRTPLNARQPPIPGSLRLSRAADLGALQELAADAFTYSRFGVDPFFSADEVRAFHREWVKNLHNGLAQAVLVSEAGGAVQGFVSCGLADSKGRIPLIAVAETARGRGVGSTLVRAALRWFQENGAREARVKTQANNVAAVALYERCGFVLERPELTFSVGFAANRRR